MDLNIELSDLNHIELSALIIAELYRDTLIASPGDPVNTTSAAVTSYSIPIAASSPSVTTPYSAPAGKASSDPHTAGAPPPQSTAPGNTSPRSAAPPQTIPGNAIPRSVTSAPPQAFTGPYKFLGANQKKITILVQSPGVAFLPDEQLNVLTKMLEACRMNMADVAMVNHAVLPVKIAALRQQLSPGIVLLFGMQPIEIELPINFPQFKIQAYDQCTYLYAPSLEEMTEPTETSKSIKGKLWACLKTLFQI